MKRYIDITNKINQAVSQTRQALGNAGFNRYLPGSIPGAVQSTLQNFSEQGVQRAIQLGVNTAATLGELGQNALQGTLSPDKYKTWDPVPINLGGSTNNLGDNQLMQTFTRQSQGQPNDNLFIQAGNIAKASGEGILGALSLGGLATGATNVIGGLVGQTPQTFLQQPIGRGGSNLQAGGTGGNRKKDELFVDNTNRDRLQQQIAEAGGKDTDVNQTVDSWLKTMKDWSPEVTKNYGKDQIDDFIRAQQNDIVLQLERRGSTELANKVAKIKVPEGSSIADFTDSVRSITGVSTPNPLASGGNLAQEAQKYSSAEDFANKAPSKVIDELRNQGIRGAEQRMAFWEQSTKGMDKTPVINSVNPTGGLLVDYTPQERMTARLGENMTTLDKTMGKSPDKTITIYRGAPKNQTKIVGGDFVTTDPELARTYTGDGNVLKLKVKLSDVLDDKTEPLGGEYLYRPKSQLIDFYNKVMGK